MSKIAYNQEKFLDFRNKYNKFYYENFSHQWIEGSLHIKYFFNINKTYHFEPTLEIPQKHFFKLNEISNEMLDNLIFHIGMVELISYWKATCCPTVVVKPFKLNEKQIAWWKKLYYNGLGEFFYLNSIKTNEQDFLNFEFETADSVKKFTINLDESTIIPVGGGKDSVVTLELLSKLNEDNKVLIINPRGATLLTSEAAGFSKENIIEVHRKIDSNLLKLNEQGYLNGHTPFSAMLAFVSILIACLCGKRNIALSNESSANEATDVVSGVNHQYSKSLEFENDFRNYVKQFINEEINYFSFLRPLSEMQIAKLFSQHQKYFTKFKSCNVGSKSDIWCCNCPKCLFAFVILAPFIPMAQMIDIFGANLFENENLKTYLDELTGATEVKPFECVGTVEEVNLSLVAFIRNNGAKLLPKLISYYLESKEYKKYKDKDINTFLKLYQDKHFLNSRYNSLLKSAIND